MRCRALDSSGDYQFGVGSSNFLIDSPELVAQIVMTRLLLWTGEWFLDQTEGTPYQQSALGTNKLQTLEPSIIERILDTEGVLEIISLSVSINSENRNVNISGEISTIYGVSKIDGIL